MPQSLPEVCRFDVTEHKLRQSGIVRVKGHLASSHAGFLAVGRQQFAS